MEFRRDSRKYGDSNEFVLEKKDIGFLTFVKKIFSFCAYVIAISPCFDANFPDFPRLIRAILIH